MGLEFILALPPTPCPRPRVPRFGSPYYPPTYAKWKLSALRLLKQHEGTLLKGALSVFIELDSSVPTSYNKKRREEALGGSVWPRPDADNLAKSVLDAITSAKLWEDDSQVVCLTVRKRYAEKDEIRVRITPA